MERKMYRKINLQEQIFFWQIAKAVNDNHQEMYTVILDSENIKEKNHVFHWQCFSFNFLSMFFIRSLKFLLNFSHNNVLHIRTIFLLQKMQVEKIIKGIFLNFHYNELHLLSLLWFKTHFSSANLCSIFNQREEGLKWKSWRFRR